MKKPGPRMERISVVPPKDCPLSLNGTVFDGRILFLDARELQPLLPSSHPLKSHHRTVSNSDSQPSHKLRSSPRRRRAPAAGSRQALTAKATFELRPQAV